MQQTGGNNYAQPSLLLSLAWMLVTASLTNILSGVLGTLIGILMYHIIHVHICIIYHPGMI